jgi:hypothetical protein
LDAPLHVGTTVSVFPFFDVDSILIEPKTNLIYGRIVSHNDDLVGDPIVQFNIFMPFQQSVVSGSIGAVKSGSFKYVTELVQTNVMGPISIRDIRDISFRNNCCGQSSSEQKRKYEWSYRILRKTNTTLLLFNWSKL